MLADYAGICATWLRWRPAGESRHLQWDKGKDELLYLRSELG